MWSCAVLPEVVWRASVTFERWLDAAWVMFVVGLLVMVESEAALATQVELLLVAPRSGPAQYLG